MVKFFKPFELEKTKKIENIQKNKAGKKIVFEKKPKEFNSKNSQENPILKSISKKIKSTVKNFLSFAGYILYVYSETHLNCKLIPLSTLSSTIRINKDESIYLGKPALFIEGKPLWIIVREIPYSIELELRDIKEFLIDLDFPKKEIDEKIKDDNTLLVRKGYSSSDIDAKTYSLVAKRVFRIPKMSMSNVILILLLMLSSCLITYLITSMYFQAILD